MSVIRSTLMICLTFAIGLVMVLFYIYYQNRYEIVGQNGVVYVLDRKESVINYCNGEKCRPLNSLDPSQFYSKGREAIIIPQHQLQSLLAQNTITPQQSNTFDGARTPAFNNDIGSSTGSFANNQLGSSGLANNSFSASAAQNFSGGGQNLNPGSSFGPSTNQSESGLGYFG